MKTTDGITIDREFKNLIPVIGDEERKQLEENIIEFGGARDPLVVWSNGDRDILIDGHNRYEICTRLGLTYHVEAMDVVATAYRQAAPFEPVRAGLKGRQDGR